VVNGVKLGGYRVLSAGTAWKDCEEMIWLILVDLG